MRSLRCAVYTRKSTEDGLEQEFNSLDAQREACEAYVLSQRHEGWSLVQGRYDDGGFSGGNMARPGLTALLAAIDAGEVDVIVVYKVDRLTRSLADFAKIVERLDAKEASFVSVTQAFNTTTSMGRLTLNVLLSFAQFEREVTGERIRDKIAASKKKGIWMGGPVPLGYQVIERKLVQVPDEAERVRSIMRRYLECGSVPTLIATLERQGIVTKVQRGASGPHRGGIPFRRGSLFYLLKNPTYRGMIVHHGKAYEGEHQRIVDEDLWNAVQAKLAEKAPPRARPTNDKQQAVLRGLLTDPQGRPMVPTYGSKGSRRYCYYESRRDLARNGTPPATRFQRGQLERQVVEHLAKLLADEHALRRLSGLNDADALRRMLDAASKLRIELEQPQSTAIAVRSLVRSIAVGAEEMHLSLDSDALSIADGPSWCWSIPHPARKPFREAKVRIGGATSGLEPDEALVELLREARKVQKLVLASPDLTLLQLEKREGRCRKQMAKLLRLSWLSPRVVDGIAEGRQSPRLTRKQLLDAELPIEWQTQEASLGLGA